MALILKNTLDRPLGQFDLLDATYKAGVRGGELMTWVSVTDLAGGGTDEASADVNEDGYAYNKTRPAVTFAGATSVPLFLSDDGGLSGPGYGTLLGAVVGGQVGQQANGPFQLYLVQFSAQAPGLVPANALFGEIRDYMA